MMTFAFESDRLRVLTAAFRPWPNKSDSTVFLAFQKTPGAVQTVVQLILTDSRLSAQPPWDIVYCELVEVSALFRGAGYGGELFRAVEQFLGCEMVSTAVTPDGEKLLRSLGRPVDGFGEIIRSACAPIFQSPRFQAICEGELTSLSATATSLNLPVAEFIKTKLPEVMSIAPLYVLQTVVSNRQATREARWNMVEQLLPLLNKPHPQIT